MKSSGKRANTFLDKNNAKEVDGTDMGIEERSSHFNALFV